VLGLGEVAARLIAFAATVYLARTLGASAFGIIGFATAITLYLARIADCGIEYFGLGIREVAEDPERITPMVSSVTVARIIVACITAGVVAIVAFFAPQPDGRVVALYGLTLISLAASMRWVLLGLERARVVAISRVAGEALFAGLVLLGVKSSTDIMRVPVAQFLGDALGALIVGVVIWRSGYHLRAELNWGIVGPLFRRSWRLVASALLGLVIYNSGLILLRFFRDSASVGYFAAAYTFVSFMLNLGGSYNQSLLPALTRDRERSASLYRDALVHAFAGTLPVAAGGTIVAGALVAAIFGDGYVNAALVLKILLWTIPFALMREVATAGLMSRSGEVAVLRFTSWTALASLALNLVLIPWLGLAGAAIAAVATEIVRFAAALVLAEVGGFSPANPVRFWKPLAAGAAMTAVLVFANFGVVAEVLLGVIVYLALLAALGGFRFRGGALPEIVL
jgi:O-antigen/teichoic acid export membrane protein